MKLARKIIGALTALSLMITPVAHAQSSTNEDSSSKYEVTVSQGDKIYVAGTYCQVGYVDKETGNIYTAKHCVKHSKAGEIAYFRGDAIGYTQEDVDYVNPMVGDVIALKAFDGVVLGSNSFSGDHLFDYESITPGMQVCARSTRLNKTTCGKVAGIGNGVIGAYFQKPAINGDSGGPMWAVDKDGLSLGFVGVYSHHYTYEIEDEDGTPVTETAYMSITHKPCLVNPLYRGYYDGADVSCGLRDDRPDIGEKSTLARPTQKAWKADIEGAFENLSSTMNTHEPLPYRDVVAFLRIIASFVGAAIVLWGGVFINNMIQKYGDVALG